MNLTKQEKKVLDYIAAHRGCTTKDIILGTGITCPSARITTLRQKGLPIKSIGKLKYAGAHAFELYALAEEKAKQLELLRV